ncbi:membrane protein-like protein [Denitrovibrio acetiphilus DSM 12809]|uniref:Membrane protein-like protein n=1 Tax=Denitrovibrio acetiphilus (strain DSM 12809 / NBRC 114555 / N2460) TaxID=522772 RepID=D4H7G6_DENA2|nr:Gx transporter family protein [Denitrovibrio acetiphilus]ADD67965.1 membrane protein-like protein [Denitrovibrio acetiphilus DSM 12809]
MTQSQSKRLATTGLFAALTVTLGVFETFVALPVPGVRMGLSNVGIMMCLYILDFPAAIYVALAKSILVPLLTGNLLVKMSISMPATLCATAAMALYIFLSGRFTSPLSTGAVGAFVHISVQFFAVKNLYIKADAIYNLLPYFTLFSVLTGAVTGYITIQILKNFPGVEECT